MLAVCHHLAVLPLRPCDEFFGNETNLRSMPERYLRYERVRLPGRSARQRFNVEARNYWSVIAHLVRTGSLDPNTAATLR